MAILNILEYPDPRLRKVATPVAAVTPDIQKLVRDMETWVSSSVKEGKITLQEGKEFLANYRSGLYGYTYLE